MEEPLVVRCKGCGSTLIWERKDSEILVTHACTAKHGNLEQYLTAQELKLAEARPPLGELAWLIYFEDAAMAPEIFIGEGGGKAARERYDELRVNWNVTLFFSDVAVAEIVRTVAIARDFVQGKGTKAVNAITLHKPDGTPTGWTMCGECGQVACPGNEDITRKCCTCYECGEPLPRVQGNL